VLSDVRLPVMSGDQLAREVRRMHPEMPVVLMTGFSSTVTHENALALGVTAVLQKPISGRELVTAVRDSLSGSTRLAGTCRSV
jgi:DNA-binding NtrC family response regulator